MRKPKKVDNPDYNCLIQCIDEYMTAVETGQGDVDDLQHYIFETALEAVYGTEVFNWVNETME